MISRQTKILILLRTESNIHWRKDRGRKPEREQVQFPWFWNHGEFTGDRINDIHLTNAEKRTARDRAEANSHD